MTAPRLKLSKYVALPPAAETALWRHPYNGLAVGFGPHLRVRLQRLLAGAAPDALDQLIAAELLDAGFLLPPEIEDEEPYLDALHPLQRAAPALFGLPHAALDAIPSGTAAAFFGVPCDLGADRAGTANGPALVRQASQRFTWRARDREAVFAVNGGRHPLAALAAVDLGDLRLSRATFDGWLEQVERVFAAIPSDTLPVMIGGDHGLTWAGVSAMRRKLGRSFTFVQFDYHPDVEFHGPFAAAAPVTLRPVSHSNFVSHLHAADPALAIVQIGVEHYQCADSGMREATQAYLRNLGRRFTNLDMLEISDAAILDAIGRDKEIYLSFDVDVLDGEELSATGFPAELGLGYGRALTLLKQIIANNRLIALDLMEFGVVPSGVTDKVRREAYRMALLLSEALGSATRHRPTSA